MGINKELQQFEVDSDNDNISELIIGSDKEVYINNSQVQASTAVAGSALILDNAATGKLKFKTATDKSAALDGIVTGTLATPVGDNTEYFMADANGDALNQIPSSSIVVRDNTANIWRSSGGVYVQSYTTINNTVLNVDSYANHVIYRVFGGVSFAQITGINPGKYHGQLLSIVFGGVNDLQYVRLAYNATGVFPGTLADIVIGDGSYLQLFWDNVSSLWRKLTIVEPSLFTYVSQTASQVITANAATTLTGYTSVTSNPSALFNTTTSTYTAPARGLYSFEVKNQGTLTLGAAPQGAEFIVGLNIAGVSRYVSTYEISSRGAASYSFRPPVSPHKIFLNAGNTVTINLTHIGSGTAITTINTLPITAGNWFKVSRETV